MTGMCPPRGSTTALGPLLVPLPAAFWFLFDLAVIERGAWCSQTPKARLNGVWLSQRKAQGIGQYSFGGGSSIVQQLRTFMSKKHHLLIKTEA